MPPGALTFKEVALKGFRDIESPFGLEPARLDSTHLISCSSTVWKSMFDSFTILAIGKCMLQDCCS